MKYVPEIRIMVAVLNTLVATFTVTPDAESGATTKFPPLSQYEYKDTAAVAIPLKKPTLIAVVDHGINGTPVTMNVEPVPKDVTENVVVRVTTLPIFVYLASVIDSTEVPPSVGVQVPSS